MLRLIRLSLLLPLWLTGCANMQPAQSPDLVLQESHLFGVTVLAFDPDGKRIASGGFQGDVAIWRVPDGSPLMHGRWHPDAVRGLHWVEPERLLSASENGRLVLSDSPSGHVIRQRETPEGLTSTAYLAASRTLVAGYRDGRLRQFSYPALEPVAELEVGSAVVALASDHAGSRLAVSTGDQRVLVTDAGLSQPRPLASPPRTALTLRFSPDGRQLGAGAWYELFYWDLESGELRTQATEHWGAVTAIDFDPRGKRLVSLGRHTDASLRLVQVTDGQVLRRLQAHRLCGAAVRFSPDGRFVASGSDDESIRLYNLAKPYLPVSPRHHW